MFFFSFRKTDAVKQKFVHFNLNIKKITDTVSKMYHQRRCRISLVIYYLFCCFPARLAVHWTDVGKWHKKTAGNCAMDRNTGNGPLTHALRSADTAQTVAPADLIKTAVCVCA